METTPTQHPEPDQDIDTEGGNTRDKAMDNNDAMEPATDVETLQITSNKFTPLKVSSVHQELWMLPLTLLGQHLSYLKHPGCHPQLQLLQ